jgi:hypothetical protein
VHVSGGAHRWCWLDLEGEGRVDDEGARKEEEHGAVGVEGGVLLGRDVGEGAMSWRSRRRRMWVFRESKVERMMMHPTMTWGG